MDRSSPRDKKIITALLSLIPEERVKSRYIDRVSWGADAGFYFLLPVAIVQPVSEKEIVDLFRFSKQHQVPLVFRTGGTSLSGQSITDGLLIDLSQYWNQLSVQDKGALVRVQPGITGAMVNAWLRKYGRKIGPDPSSISAAMMGGILSNNSSGMCCGVSLNAYHTTRYLRFILPDGKTFSTEVPEDYDRFVQECGSLAGTLSALRKEILDNDALREKIRKKYTTKNTVGYSLNAFIDHEHPLDIMARLLIGAEGTLAFIAEAVMDTVPDYAFKSTALLYFPDIFAACEAIVPLKHAGAEAVELMDRASLRSVESFPGMPADVKLLPDAAAALLVEFQENSELLLKEKVEQFLVQSDRLQLLSAPVFTMDADGQAFLWKVRKGLFPAVGAVRKSGTTVILEDVAFPLERLGEAVNDLHGLFKTFQYDNAIIFGHAKDGNLHFVVTQSFNTPEEIDRYDRFLRAVVEVVVHRYDGSLKAEHGTGRNIAPFVETEWGGDAYRIMKKLKEAIDPAFLLNPGVIINDAPDAHILHLKSLPTVEEEVDRCIECGYCEHKCPSRNITTTPRRRIIIRRELERLKESGDRALHDLLVEQYQYDGLETCAVDGLCATACPVYINTGDLVKRLRRENHSTVANRIALFTARNFRLMEFSARTGLFKGRFINTLFGKKAMTRLTTGVRRMISAVPRWPEALSTPPALPVTENSLSGTAPDVIYFPACISRVMGSGCGDKKNLMVTFLSVARKAGLRVEIPKDIRGSCCGQIYSSKGYSEAYQYTANRVVEWLYENSRSGAVPVVTDVSSCTYTLHQLRPALTKENQEKFDGLVIMDSVEFLHDRIMPVLPPGQKKGSVALHPVCSLEKMGTGGKFVAVAKYYADEVVMPMNGGCCGMAGDRGFLFPELTASATAPEAADLKGVSCEGYYSSTKTCEMALTQAVGKNYESLLYLVDETT